MATSTGVKYIGNNDVYEDNILRTGLTWSKGETHILPEVMAKEFLKHPGMFAEVPGASYLIASTSDVGLGSTIAAGAKGIGIIQSGVFDNSWLLPKHLPILSPDMFQGMSGIGSGPWTMTNDTTVSEFALSSIKLSASAAGSTSILRLPLKVPVEQGVLARKQNAGGAVHWRIKCSDWSKVTRLYVLLTQDGGVVNYYRCKLIDSGLSSYGVTDPAYASAWSGKWRTFVVESRRFEAVGSPAAWGESAKFFECDGVGFALTSTAAVDLWVDRVYSPDWPVALISTIADGAYKTTSDLFLQDLTSRGYGWGAAPSTTTGTGEFPGYSDLQQLAQKGVELFAHGHVLSGISATTTNSTTTAAQLAPVLGAQRWALSGIGADPQGMRWHQWLGNSGNSAGDTAAWLKTYGINGARGDTIDGEYGINPYNSAAVPAADLSNVNYGSWVQRRGRFNCGYFPAHNGLIDPDRGNYASSNSNLRKGMEYALLTNQTCLAYFHSITDSPTSIDVRPAYYQDYFSHGDSAVRAGRAIWVGPAAYNRLTYWRSGEVFLRWDGEWAYRHDPTKIAF